MKRIRAGCYLYKGYVLQKCGYYPPEKTTYWEAIDQKNMNSDYHAKTKKMLKQLIDKNLINDGK